MPRYDFTAPRLFVEAPLASQAEIPLDPAQAHYLRNVLRLGPGDFILVFNGRDGEWRATLREINRKSVVLIAQEFSRPQLPAYDLHYLFAPLKQARLDYMVQKAVEMGASRLCPVVTHRTGVARVNLERMRANAIEAAEQCGILAIPEIAPVIRLDAVLASLGRDRLLVFCDEDAPVRDPVAALRAVATSPSCPLAVLIGPEGGFDPQEREALLALPQALRLSLGPRILRADTAAVAALALTQAVLGDWCG
jgi:16S rRNA (uracil1498-N3)-methyltransferase